MALFFFFFLHVFFTILNSCNAKTPPKFPAILIFGDSTVDTGNNNFILTPFRADHFPYGQEFPGHVPSGRFSDGKLVPDFLASELGIKESVVPPFLDPNLSGDELRTGVSFASAGSGLDDLTSVIAGVIPMSRQIEYFKIYVKKLEEMVGKGEAKKILNGALVIICSGTNDFGFSFYDIPTRRFEFNISGYQDFLQNRLQNFVKELYDFGCRKIVIAGLPPVGCLPIQMTIHFGDPIHGTCLEDQNSDSQSYNQKLKKLLPHIQESLLGSTIVYADIYENVIDMINRPQKYGFVETKRGCCGTGLVETGPLCNLITPTCANPSQYLPDLDPRSSVVTIVRDLHSNLYLKGIQKENERKEKKMLKSSSYNCINEPWTNSDCVSMAQCYLPLQGLSHRRIKN
ncbi:hypothetical protein L1049_012735 [Liquidambar formosana]|uniref:GDSL esterase/lipase At2g30310-like n=1 Tax=Liquidambar formosana TaxID=63359 RepID=A0AAP0RK10_LIQFO